MQYKSLVGGWFLALTFVVTSSLPAADDTAATELAAQLRNLAKQPLEPPKPEDPQLAPKTLSQEMRDRIRAANLQSSQEWRAIKTRDDWESFRQEKIAALRASLGVFLGVPDDLKIRVTRTLTGEGYKIENTVFESRPGLQVTSNLYIPDPPRKSMPGILIFHSHHAPKTQGELQDMGMLWARAGCLVLVMDQLGHGERRQHPFIAAADYPKEYRTSRQDYHFRYNEGMQLHLIGDSLMGWMVWDMMRGVDLLLGREGIDPKRIALLGSVAGGGDPCAVTGALDERIAAVVPFNFGGPQPETTFPLPQNAEDAFNYAGGGSWESTRNLTYSARDGFLPWVIVGAVAPRRLVYGHEFAWDREHDPVWTRLGQIYQWYDVPDRLAFAHGRGKLSGQPPESTHCNNIGPEHRKGIYEAFARWFNIQPPEKEVQTRHPSEDLLCLAGDFKESINMRPLWQMAAELGAQRAARARRDLSTLHPKDRKQELQDRWSRLVGDIEPIATFEIRFRRLLADPKIELAGVDSHIIARSSTTKGFLQILKLKPSVVDFEKRNPVVIGLSQGGIREFLGQKSDAIAMLLRAGVSVWIPDLRGTEKAGEGRGRQSGATSVSSSGLMSGQTVLGSKLEDLLWILQTIPDLDQVVLWGTSPASANSSDRNVAAPLDAPDLPSQAEPLGGLMALFGAAFAQGDDIHAIVVEGSLSGYQSVLESPFCYVPHDCIVPGALGSGDLCDMAAILAPTPLRIIGAVDGTNRVVPHAKMRTIYEPTMAAYRREKAEDAFQIIEQETPDKTVAWILSQLAR